ncbi:PaaI family thioesterase [Streptomyces sp. NPDC021080]|uniref:PaaI family thioesterase n=1 Tax=Streptomyces sp. NPDC021080 TaxID=3365110 RepID=UPI0037BBD235
MAGLDATGTQSTPDIDRGGPDFSRMIEALRLVQDRTTGAAPPHEVVTEATRALEAIAASMEPFTVPEREQITGRRLDLPGRGQALVPAFHVDEWDDEHATGRFTLSRYYLGGNGAAHGGVIPLLFDEVLGRLANTGRPTARTAYLNVNFRRITRLGVELRLHAKLEREEGRKRYLTAAIHDGDQVTADAEGLFVALLPGQP